MRSFWDQESEARETARNILLSNMAIIGGLLLAAARADAASTLLAIAVAHIGDGVGPLPAEALLRYARRDGGR